MARQRGSMSFGETGRTPVYHTTFGCMCFCLFCAAAWLSSTLQQQPPDLGGPDSLLPTAAADNAVGDIAIIREAANAFHEAALKEGRRRRAKVLRGTGDLEEDMPSILILTPIKETNERRQRRYAANLNALDYPKGLLTVVFGVAMTSASTSVVKTVASDMQRSGYRDVRVFVDRVPPAKQRVYEVDKHDFSFQVRRRKSMAQARNQLLFNAIREEHDYVLWLDDDLLQFPPDLIRRLLATGKKVVVPLCLDSVGRYQYDLNSWQATAQTAQFLEKLRSNAPFMQGYKEVQGKTVKFLKDIRSEVGQSSLVKLDGIGGTCILVDADLHRSGLIFPPFMVNHVLETEGLAQIAIKMGAQPYGLANLTIHHA